MKRTIALAGNPNTGKTTLFNALTGSNQRVGNWPGVTVEKKEGHLKDNKEMALTDLPGIYSLSPYTLEEIVARQYLLTEAPDAIINIIDGTNLERNLYLTTQLAELGIPMVLAVNMADIIEKNQEVLNTGQLSREIGCPVVEISALKGRGLDELVKLAAEAASSGKRPRILRCFSPSLENTLERIEALLPASLPEEKRRFHAIKLFENDEKVLQSLALSPKDLESVREWAATTEKEMEDDAESIITLARYEYISSIIDKCYEKRNPAKVNISDSIDRIVTNRILALPIFAAVMFIVYFVSVTTVGTIVTDWTNDELFGTIIPPTIGLFLKSIGTAPWLQGLILDGIVAGVGAVLGFVPQMFILFAFLAFLEGCGYMARIAFIMDRIFRRFGLSGKSFIPILIGTGCSVPGIMASRTIENDKDRRMTIITTSFMPCGAKLPVIALIAGALFNNEWWVAPSAYFVGIAAILFSGIVLKKSSMFKGDPAPFVIELPPYHLPGIGSILSSMWERGFSFIKKAGSVVFLSVIAIWFLQGFGFTEEGFGMVEDVEVSILAGIGRSFGWIFRPLGFGEWKSAVAAVTGLIAKENVVATFGILFGFGEVSEAGEEIWPQLQAYYTPAAAYSYLVFNLLCAPCVAAIGAMKREMNNARWTWFAIGY